MIKNSFKFSSGGSVNVYLAYDEDLENLNAVVVDDGLGIAANDIRQLFKRFRKLEGHKEIKNSYAGFGIGLLLCKQLIEANGGKLEVHSDGENAGVTARFNMPMKLSIENGL